MRSARSFSRLIRSVCVAVGVRCRARSFRPRSREGGAIAFGTSPSAARSRLHWYRPARVRSRQWMSRCRPDVQRSHLWRCLRVHDAALQRILAPQTYSRNTPLAREARPDHTHSRDSPHARLHSRATEAETRVSCARRPRN